MFGYDLRQVDNRNAHNERDCNRRVQTSAPLSLNSPWVLYAILNGITIRKITKIQKINLVNMTE